MAAGLIAISDYWARLGRPGLPLAARGRRSRGSALLLLHRARQPPRAAGRGARRERGVGGEAWEIHGGGFYRVEKFRVAPETLPSPLYWFKWEAYTTWLSGFALLVVVYYARAGHLPRRPERGRPLDDRGGAISVGGLAIGVARLRRALPPPRRAPDWALALAVTRFLALSAWAAGELFAPQAAYVEVGAMIGTIMVGNVFFVIIPAPLGAGPREAEGREPDPRWNARGKLRSVHNNYLTLPVVLAMISTHFPFLYTHSNAWLLLVVLMVLGAWTRHYFNLRHRGPERVVDPRVGGRRRRGGGGADPSK